MSLFAKFFCIMMLSDLSTFKKNIAETSYSQCLILGKDKEEAIEALLVAWKTKPVLTWDADQFSLEDFHKESETIPFLVKKIALHIRGVDRLKKEDVQGLIPYVLSPAPWVFLLLSGEQLPSSHVLVKAFEEKGILLKLAEEKPWDKERHIIERLMHEAAVHQVELSAPGAKALVKGIGLQWELLKQELYKLICYVGSKRKIGLEEIQILSCRVSQDTLWQLGESIFRGNRADALFIGRRLLDEGEAIFPLLSHLRTQVRQGLEVLSHFQAGGISAVSQHFPYLKGGLLQKKVDEMRHYGQSRLLHALILIFEAEVEAKNSGGDAHFILERLLIQLMVLPHASSFAA